jgi:hypothetical protein
MAEPRSAALIEIAILSRRRRLGRNAASDRTAPQSVTVTRSVMDPLDAAHEGGESPRIIAGVSYLMERS